MSYKVAILFSGSGTNLEQIVKQNKGDFEVPFVFTDNPNAPGIKRAMDLGLSVIVSHQTKNQTREEYCMETAQTIQHFNPDLVVLAGFMKILSPYFCEHFEGRLINVHPSLLPLHKGLNTHQRVLDAGDKYHGISIHWVTEELDAGDLIVQKMFTLTDFETAETLEAKCHVLEHAWYPWVVNQMARGLDPTDLL